MGLKSHPHYYSIVTINHSISKQSDWDIKRMIALDGTGPMFGTSKHDGLYVMFSPRLVLRTGNLRSLHQQGPDCLMGLSKFGVFGEPFGSVDR